MRAYARDEGHPRTAKRVSVVFADVYVLARLERLRFQALEDRFDAGLRLG
jgi:hypothetical protein